MVIDRAYLAGGRVGPARERLGAVCARVMARFESAGCARVDVAALHPADALLDVYGEDLRARAFVVAQRGGPELFLRPDFTVPVLQLHLAAQAEPARYAYLGPVWRRPPPGSKRPAEFLQAGLEIYGEDAAAADAEIFALIRAALADAGVASPEAVTGDLGVIIAILDATPMPLHRRTTLKRHFWRPARFQALLHRYAMPAPPPSQARAALLAAAGDPGAVATLARACGKPVGARGPDEIAARVAMLAVDADAAPIAQDCARLLDAALAVDAPSDRALALLRDMTEAAGLRIAPALDRLARRLDALTSRGEDVSRLRFRAATARTLEYYDGFVFEFAAPDRPDLPPLAGGGRYDSIARALGAGQAVAAVGGVVRPEAALAAAPC